MAEPLRELLAGEPWAAAEAFLRRWHRAAPAAAPAGVPEPLRRVHELLGGRELFLQHLLPPERIAPLDGRLAFLATHEGTAVWGLAADGRVEMREEDGPWAPVAGALGPFVLQVLVMDAAMNPPEHAAWSEYLHEGDLAAYAPLELGSPGPDRFLAGEAAVAYALPAGDGLMAWVGALHPGELPSGECWDFISARDD